MTRSPSPPDSGLPAASLILGGVSVLVVVLSLVWASTFYAEAVLTPMAVSGVLIVIVSGAGLWVGIAALRRRPRPRWMAVVGTIASVLTLLVGLYFVVVIVAVLMFFSTMSYG